MEFSIDGTLITFPLMKVNQKVSRKIKKTHQYKLFNQQNMNSDALNSYCEVGRMFFIEDLFGT